MIARGVMGRGETVLDREKKFDCQVCAWPVITVVAIIAFACIAVFSDWPWSESPWTAAAAIATFSAALVALWLGKTQSRRLMLDREEKATLVASGLIIHLELAAAKISGSRDHLSHGKRDMSDATRIAKIVILYMNSIARSIKLADIISIQPLLPKAARDLASALALTETIGDYIEHMLPELEGLKLSRNPKEKVISELLSVDEPLKILEAEWNMSIQAIQTLIGWEESVWKKAYAP